MRKKFFAAIVGLLPVVSCVVGCERAEARLFYVAPSGDNNANGTIDKPLATPSRAIGLASVGDRIVLRAGHYQLSKALYVSKAGLTIAAAPNEKVLLSAPTDENSDVQNVIVVTASRVVLANMEIRGGSYYGVKVDVDEAQTPANGVVLRGLRIGGTGRDCVKTFNADNLLIENCNIGPSGVRDASNAEGIDSIGSHKVTIRRTYIHDTATNGVYLKGGATDGLIEGCRIENTNASAGILLGQDTDQEYMRDGAKYEAIRCAARNNIVVNTGGAGVGTYSGDSISFENNTLYNVARETGAGVWIGINRRNVAARNVRIVNNIIVTSSTRPFIFVLNAEGWPTADYNLYFNSKGPAIFRTEAQGKVTTLNLKDWQRISRKDAHSKVANPALAPTNSYKPKAGSPAINRGVKIKSVTTDFSGISRVKAHKVTIGAHQVGSR